MLEEITEQEYLILQNIRNKNRCKDYVLYDFDEQMRNVVNNGFFMNDRTGTGCYYLPGIDVEIDISSRIPIPTRRKTAWKSMLKEYLWFLTGSSEINDLRAMGSNVWNFWEDPSWASKNGFPPSSIGYGYGPNLIHFGGDLSNLKENPGVNQIDIVIETLRKNPNDRGILFSFYRPDKSKSTDVKLRPCHVLYQFVVTPNQYGEMKNLNCIMYQRSSDMFVGNLSTNLQGGAFYTYMIAQQVGMVPCKLYHKSGHAHVYADHVNLVKEYLNRPIVKSPILKLNKRDSIYDYTADDFELEDYSPLPKMNVPISV